MVDDHAEVIELLVAGKHGGLPDLALLALAIAQQGVRAVSIAPVLGGNRHTHGGRDTLAERAGGHVDARGVVHVGMTLQVAADMAQRLEVLLGEEPALGEHGVQARSAVALGEHKAIAVGLAGIGRVDVHFLKVQIGHDVGSAERTARMAGLGSVHAGDDALPYLVGNLFELFVAHCAFLSSSLDKMRTARKGNPNTAAMHVRHSLCWKLMALPEFLSLFEQFSRQNR